MLHILYRYVILSMCLLYFSVKYLFINIFSTLLISAYDYIIVSYKHLLNTYMLLINAKYWG